MMRPGSALTKAKTSKTSSNVVGSNIAVKQIENKIPQLQDYIKNRDWVGAIAFLENEKRLLMNFLLFFCFIFSHFKPFQISSSIFLQFNFFLFFFSSFSEGKQETNLWLAYSYFHNGDYKQNLIQLKGKHIFDQESDQHLRRTHQEA